MIYIPYRSGVEVSAKRHKYLSLRLPAQKITAPYSAYVESRVHMFRQRIFVSGFLPFYLSTLDLYILCSVAGNAATNIDCKYYSQRSIVNGRIKEILKKFGYFVNFFKIISTLAY